MSHNRSVSTTKFSTTGHDLRRFVQGGVDNAASLVTTTYGPQGLDKLIELNGSKNEVVVELTSSGTGILDAIQRGDGFNHPIAAILVDAVDTMHRDLHDGSTAAIILTQALLNRGYELIDQGLTPADISIGYAIAAGRVGQVFDDLMRPVCHNNTSLLKQVTRTTMAPRLNGEVNEQYVQLVVDAVQGLAAETDGEWIDTKQVKLITAPGTETDLHEGVIVTRWPRGAETSDRSLVDFEWTSQYPTPIEDATVAIIDAKPDLERTTTNFGSGNYSGVHLDSLESVERYHSGLRAHKRNIIERLADLGIDVLVSQVRVDDDLVRLFAERDIDVVDRVETPRADIDRLANATGATVVSALEDITVERLGTAGWLYEQRMADEKWTYFTKCGGGTYTITLRTPTDHSAEHYLSVIEDGLDVTTTAAIDGQLLPGAGAAQMTAAAVLRKEASAIGGREALAVSAFAAALEDIVRILVKNGGLDPIDTIADLRTVHTEDGGDAIGIDSRTGESVNVWKAGIVEPRRVFSQALETGRTMATQFLSIDAFLHPNISLAQFRPNTEHH